MSNDISTMHTKDRNKKAGRNGYTGCKTEKETVIRPGDYILQRGKRDKRND